MLPSRLFYGLPLNSIVPTLISPTPGQVLAFYTITMSEIPHLHKDMASPIGAILNDSNNTMASSDSSLNYPAKPTRPNWRHDLHGLFQNCLQYPFIVLSIALHMSLDEIIAIYSSSRQFHEILDQNMTSFIHNRARIYYPHASKIFVYTAYPRLCIPESSASDNVPLVPVRLIPTLRWIGMIEHKEKALGDIFEKLAEKGFILPCGSAIALRKLWLTMEIFDTNIRIGFLQNQYFWTNTDLRLAITFLLKLDMYFAEPVVSCYEVFQGLREFFMMQKGLGFLRDFMTGRSLKNSIDLIQMFLYTVGQPSVFADPVVFGVPASRFGIISRQNHRDKAEPLARIDTLVLRESVRRDMEVHTEFMPMMIFGYKDFGTDDDL
jgi:hypothetical protein